MRITDNIITTNVWGLFNKWAKKFRYDFRRIYDNNLLVKDQIDFMRLYVSHMLLDGTTAQNARRIKRFLSMQKVVNDGTKMELRFIGGSPVEVFVLVEKIRDVDIADIYGITEFQKIYVFKGKNKRWTNKSANEFIEALKRDVEFDYLLAEVDYEFLKNELNITCSIN